MKKQILVKLMYIGCWLVVFNSHNLYGKNHDDNFLAQNSIVFFEDAPKSVIDRIKLSRKYLSQDKAIVNLKYPAMAKNILWNLKLVLKQKFIPELSFILKHMRLVPASNIKTNMDTAFIAYRYKQYIFMHVATNWHLCLFVHYLNENRQKENSKNLSTDFITFFFNDKFKEKQPNYTISSTNYAVIALSQYKLFNKMIQFSKIIFYNNDVCFSYGYAKESRAARQPLNNEWFKWEQIKMDAVKRHKE